MSDVDKSPAAPDGGRSTHAGASVPESQGVSSLDEGDVKRADAPSTVQGSAGPPAAAAPSSSERLATVSMKLYESQVRELKERALVQRCSVSHLMRTIVDRALGWERA